MPSEAWAQLLFYRNDLFDAAGLPAPDHLRRHPRTPPARSTAASCAGFVGATAPGDAFTQQTFEHIALANGCELVDEAGEITIDSPQCVAAFDFYRDLITNYSVPGAQDVDTVRATYFAGQAAMAIWSTFLLDELAGLRNDALPSCPECADDPTFLASNTGIVTALQGPDGTEPAQFGEVISWAITAEADGRAGAAVRPVHAERRLRRLARRSPRRASSRSATGSSPGATDFVDTWETLPVGRRHRGPAGAVLPAGGARRAADRTRGVRPVGHHRRARAT